MTQLRFVVAAAALCSLLLGCPKDDGAADGGAGDGGDGGALTGGCTGGCGPNLACDVARHVCIDPCGGCESGVCQKNASGAWGCLSVVTSCAGATCAPGQTTCVADGCSCVDPAHGGEDTCAAAGRICQAQYNPVTQLGGSCEAPRRYEECRTGGCTGGDCAACPSGESCVKGLFGDEIGTCLKECPNGSAECDVDERCDSQAQVCYPRSLFTAPDCVRFYPYDGGGTPDDAGVTDAGDAVVAAVVGEGCSVIADDGTHEPLPTGNCSYSIFQLTTQKVPIANCRPAGDAGVNTLCRRDFAPTAANTRCGTGLECVLTSAEEGLCLPLCNASLAGSCPGGQACVNLQREPNRVASLGACMRQCDLFATDGGQTCPAYGATPASCVPAPPDGLTAVTDDGKGFCMPRQPTAAVLGQACAETDPLRGAACVAGSVCNLKSPAPTCEQPCDLGCVVSPGPARCAKEANARCPSNRTCTAISSTSSAILGFCR